MSSDRKLKKQQNPLVKWLTLNWDRPERSYNPDVRDFLAGLLDYPKERVVTEDKGGGGGYPDIKLLTPEKIAWVVGDLKKDDSELTKEIGRTKLWNQKSKYVEGLTRYVLFLTAKYLWIVLPTGEPVDGFEFPIDLSATTFEQLKEQLKFISAEQAEHHNQWTTFIEGKLPYIYLKLDTEATLNQLRQDLQTSFAELSIAGEEAIARLFRQHQEYQRRKQEIEQNLAGAGEAQRRALMRVNHQFEFERRLFEDILPQFEEQYGREVSAKGEQVKARIREAFVADSVAVLIARVLFLRLIEDLQLTKKRRLTNGGPKNWADFVDHLTGDARALVRLIAEDVGRLYKEPFERNVFDWLYQTNGILDQALQRLILRFNAYDFSGLSEEILGDIYQAFLPTAKRKRLGEFYTPTSIVDWLLDQTIFSHDEGKILDPSCGSGSFLVRYVHRRLEDIKARGIAQDDVLQELQTNVWGFDLNPFATFISHFQLMWAMLRVKPSSTPPTIHVYNLNSLLKDADLIPFLGDGYLSPGSQERDTEQWKYIIGNPPYIRAERVKYGEEMRGLWQQIWGQNADTGLVFLYRALTESLQDGGFLGMVVSGGYANSEAAAKVWKLLYPRQEAALRKVVWLEFVDKPIWDVARVPLILVIEKTPAQEDDQIELYVPSQWPSDEAPVKIKYGDFFDAKVSPRVTDIDPSNPLAGRWGDYLLPLLHAEDIPILKKLYPNGNGSNIVELKEAVAQQISRSNRPFSWTYGIQRGGVEVTPEPTGDQPIQVIAGRSLAVGWPGEPAGWVDLEAVKNRPNGKLSLWSGNNPSEFIAVPTLAKSLFASVVKSNQEVAAVNTVLLAIPKKGGAKAKSISAFINSKLARFYFAVRLRSSVIQGYYATLYPRNLDALPWLRNLDAAIEQRLVDSYNQLSQFAAIAKNNPDEWLLSQVENRIGTKRYKLSDRTLNINFINWCPEDIQAEELSLDGSLLKTGLFYLDFLNADLAELVYKLITINSDEDTSISGRLIQKLVIPQDYSELMQEYRQRVVDFQQVEADFFNVLADIDAAVYEMFGLTDAEKAHIENRLASFPLNKLQPRYPWQTVRPRPIKAYTEDRFT
ncbi:N-6 DNA methylase [Cronbergia sp. UHCC 0137]|uniref:HsdM family class I SAM-dependent methyltransferase n=1 Tax=Cronbergia sp. UHCC 0137 TaxID=3110239 RepID=UPI002B1F647C|nr:N-6 DNA methylase [Cronbergia sp. UHCC 0137]MEA5618899.1 N-6 DNA methylase [Cronbergia sp. UHCC 0137]